jgi:hypothetical protein
MSGIVVTWDQERVMDLNRFCSAGHVMRHHWSFQKVGVYFIVGLAL